MGQPPAGVEYWVSERRDAVVVQRADGRDEEARGEAASQGLPGLQRVVLWRAARKLVALAANVKAVQDGRINIERINAPFMIELKGSGREFGAGLRYAIERGGYRSTKAAPT